MKMSLSYISLAVALLMAGFTTSAYAGERIYLRSGSNLVCDHTKAIDGQVRLYLTSSEENYLDVAAKDIVRAEIVSAAIVPADAIPLGPASGNARLSSAASIPAHSPATTKLDLSALLHDAGAEHHLDPDLLASVVHTESGGKPRVVSRAGAAGLMQLMPGTAAQLGVRDSFVPEQNVAGGATYLDALLMYYHEDLARALAAYNAGPAAVDRYRGIPPYAETRRYVQRVIHDYNQRKLREARRKGIHFSPSASHIVSIAAVTTAPTR